MIVQNLQQGGPEWHAYRASMFNASDAPAMLDVSDYKSRTKLLHEMSTGTVDVANTATQRRFADGHRFEALARPLAEAIVGMPLPPVVGSVGKLSASFDGLSPCSSIAWEHKTLNDKLRAAMVPNCTGGDLPMQYQVQMEQQLMVSGAARCLFMASKWEGNQLVEQLHCWYESNPTIRTDIVQGWRQFRADLAGYVHTEVAAKPVANVVTDLPAVLVRVSGGIVIKDNFQAFEVALLDFIANRLILNPATDQDFADLELQIKALKKAECALADTDMQILAQVPEIGAAKRMKDMLLSIARDNRLMAEKLVASEKERIRLEAINQGVNELVRHIEALNKKLQPYSLPHTAMTDFAKAIKGKRTIEGMQNAVSTALANAKIEANTTAKHIQMNEELLNANAEFDFLFPDAQMLVCKGHDELAAIVKNRVAEHQARTATVEVITKATQVQEPVVHAATPAPSGAPTLSLSRICGRLDFTVTANFLSRLGFEPVAADGDDWLYREDQFAVICAALITHTSFVSKWHT